MNLKLDRKLINIISFVLILILGFYLLSRIYLIFHDSGIKIRPIYTYIFLLLIILVSFVQLILNLIIKEKVKLLEVPDNKDKEKKIEKEIETIKEDNTHKKTSLNTKEILNRIVPNKMPKLEEYGETLFINMSNEFEIVQGILFAKNLSENTFSGVSFYAYFSDEKPQSFKEGDTIPGQVARNKEVLQISNIPDNYIRVLSGLGEGNPNYLIFIPVLRDDTTIAIIEIASFKNFSEEYLSLFKDLGNKISTTLYNSYIKGTENTKDGKK